MLVKARSSVRICVNKHGGREDAVILIFDFWAAKPVHLQDSKKKSLIAFFTYGVFERRVQKPTPPPVSCRRWGATMWMMKTYCCLRSIIFHISSSCSGEGDEGADCVLTVWLCRKCGRFSFSLWRTNSSSSHHFYVLLRFGKKGGCFVLLICWA